MRQSLTLAVTFLTLLFSKAALGLDKSEIDHLLSFVATTSCSYERNGDLHTGKEAVAHIKKKYHYHSDKIKSAEDFITYAATKSMLSGSYYKIHCQGKPVITSKAWLLTELSAYRRTKPEYKAGN